MFHAGGGGRGGSSVIVLPCGAGKTVVGITAMCLLQKNTLVLTTSVTAVKQWRREITERTTLTEDEVKEYTGDVKEIEASLLATYQILTYRPDKTEEFPHFGLFDKRDWGLIVYDEVHLLPAPVFRVTATIQARRRLGLTATLIREDGREGDVFSLIGPKKYDVPWRELETKGWIASASCTEIRVALPDDANRMAYAVADHRAKYRIASENEAKDDVVEELLARYHGQRADHPGGTAWHPAQLKDRFDLPIIHGEHAQCRA
ncbi:MAG: DEAD/DEAH box helicase family protein [Gemmataceae bacterium]